MVQLNYFETRQRHYIHYTEPESLDLRNFNFIQNPGVSVKKFFIFFCLVFKVDLTELFLLKQQVYQDLQFLFWTRIFESAWDPMIRTFVTPHARPQGELSGTMVIPLHCLQVIPPHCLQVIQICPQFKQELTWPLRSMHGAELRQICESRYSLCYIGWSDFALFLDFLNWAHCCSIF